GRHVHERRRPDGEPDRPPGGRLLDGVRFGFERGGQRGGGAAWRRYRGGWRVHRRGRGRGRPHRALGRLVVVGDGRGDGRRGECPGGPAGRCARRGREFRQ